MQNILKNLLLNSPLLCFASSLSLVWRGAGGEVKKAGREVLVKSSFLSLLFSLLSLTSWAQVDCNQPMNNGTSFSFNTTNNAITGIFNAQTNIFATNEIQNTTYLAPEITLHDGFKATSNSEVLLSVTNCPLNTATADLMIRDFIADTGNEPSTIDFSVWQSPDIWIRNMNDNGTAHQTPINGLQNWIYVRVKNLSTTKASLGYETLTVHWAPSSTMNVGRCGMLLGNTNATGYATATIPAIPANGEQIVKFPFTPNAPIDQQQTIQAVINNGKAHGNPICSLSICNISGSKKMALKNLVFVNPASGSRVSVWVGNHQETTQAYDLEFYISDTETGKPIYQEAEVTIKMDDILYTAWSRGNKQTERVETTTDETKRIIKGNEALFKNFVLNPNELGKIELSFNFLIEELTTKTNYTYHLVQKNTQTGEVVGGCSFQIDKDLRDPFDAFADDKLADLNQSITISANDIGEAAVYNWYDSEGNLVGQGKNLDIANAVAEKYKLEVISSVDGFKDYTDVEVKIRPNRLINLYPNPTNGNINIEYKINEGTSAYLMVLNYYMNGSISNNYVLDVSSSQINLDLSSYPLGFYRVALVVDGVIVDVKIVSKY